MQVLDDEQLIRVLKSANKDLGQLARDEQKRANDLEAAGHRLALELECLLMDTKDLPTVSKWWDSAHEALEAWRALHNVKVSGDE